MVQANLSTGYVLPSHHCTRSPYILLDRVQQSYSLAAGSSSGCHVYLDCVPARRVQIPAKSQAKQAVFLPPKHQPSRNYAHTVTSLRWRFHELQGHLSMPMWPNVPSASQSMVPSCVLPPIVLEYLPCHCDSPCLGWRHVHRHSDCQHSVLYQIE